MDEVAPCNDTAEEITYRKKGNDKRKLNLDYIENTYITGRDANRRAALVFDAVCEQDNANDCVWILMKLCGYNYRRLFYEEVIRLWEKSVNARGQRSVRLH